MLRLRIKKIDMIFRTLPEDPKDYVGLSIVKRRIGEDRIIKQDIFKLHNGHFSYALYKYKKYPSIIDDVFPNFSYPCKSFIEDTRSQYIILSIKKIRHAKIKIQKT